MPMSARIRCINRSDLQNACERIINVGGVSADGTAWKVSEDEAIAGFENGNWELYVHVGKNTAAVIIEKSVPGRKYLKTENDGVVPNNLLSLPEGP